jgi:release factor glutamine methyltransferase
VYKRQPYICSEEYEKLPEEVKAFEPFESLHAGKEGLEVYKRILKSILPYIYRDLCVLLFEIDPGLSDSVKELMTAELGAHSLELKEVAIEKDYNQCDRIIKAVIVGKA